MPAPADYIDVAQRIADFKAKHPDGCLRPADITKPYTIETIEGQTYIVVVAAAYRSKDDTLPGIGMAYELFPGKTNFTRGSELQNAETSAWGRAIVASLDGDTKKGIASSEEVRNRQAEQNLPISAPPANIETLFVDLLEATKSAVNAQELTKAGNDVAANVKHLSKAQVAALQQAWKETNTVMVMERLDNRIQKLGEDGPATKSDYDAVLDDIKKAKLSPEIEADFISQLGDAFGAADQVSVSVA